MYLLLHSFSPYSDFLQNLVDLKILWSRLKGRKHKLRKLYEGNTWCTSGNHDSNIWRNWACVTVMNLCVCGLSVQRNLLIFISLLQSYSVIQYAHRRKHLSGTQLNILLQMPKEKKKNKKTVKILGFLVHVFQMWECEIFKQPGYGLFLNNPGLGTENRNLGVQRHKHNYPGPLLVYVWQDLGERNDI